MAKMTGVFTGIRGKVGAMIFQVNKGVQIIKNYARPENPQSSGQTAVRLVFSSIVSAYKILASTWIRYMWNPFLSGNDQGWGKFIGTNLVEMDGTFAGEAGILSLGSLEGVVDLAATYDTATGAVDITYDGTILANGASTDYPQVAIYDKIGKSIITMAFDGDQREEEEISLTTHTGLTATDVYVYLTMTDAPVSPGPIGMCSNSQVCACTAPV